MKINANSVRVGNVLVHQDKLWKVLKLSHTQPGKGGAYVQVEMKELRTGTKMNERFRSSETLEKARLEQKEYQFLYGDDEGFYFMDQESYEQLQLGQSDVDEAQIPYLTDGVMVEIEFYEESPIGLTLPEQVVLEVTDTEAVIKGQTAAGSYKPATLNNGVRVTVPPHIGIGDKIVVNPIESNYIERFKG